jgi:hypothetical protein
MTRIRGLLLLLVLGCALAALAQPPPAPPSAIRMDGVALVPVRPLAAILGAEISFTPAAGVLTLARGDSTMRMTVNAATATRNGTPFALPAPIIYQNQLFVPTRAIGESFGAGMAVHGSTASDPAQHLTVTYGERTAEFRIIAEGRRVAAAFTGQPAAAFAVANLPGIDAYNSRYLSDIIPLQAWLVRDNRELWRATLASGVSITQFAARDVTGDARPELLLTNLARHSYMGPYPGSIYHAVIYRWDGATMRPVLALDFSRDHGRLTLQQPNPARPATIVLVDTNWQRNEDISHVIRDTYAWNGTRFTRTRHVLSRRLPAP